MKQTSMIAASLVVAIGLAGCTTENKNAGRAYCDETGCYKCDINDDCWPIPNQKCTSDSECSANQKCTTIGCADLCSSDADCAGDDVICVTGFCVPWGFTKVKPYAPTLPCTDDSGCATDEFCDAGACKPKCTSDDDCGPDKVCSSCGKCQPKGTPATCGAIPMFCSNEVPCGSGKTCQTGRCHFQCSTSDICPVGQLCSGGLCTDDPSPASPECALDLDCTDGACINGYCHPGCTTSAECGPGALCQMGICQPDYTTGN